MAKRWQGAKAARKGLGPRWNVLRAGFETLWVQNFELASQGQRAKGALEGFVSQCRCGNRLNAIFDLAKRWQRAKAACTEGFGALVERASRRFWNPLNAEFRQGKGERVMAKCCQGLKLHARVWGPGGTCFAQVLKPTKCSISTWQGRGKGLKLHGGFWGPGGTCFAQVLKPSLNLNAIFRPGKARAKGDGKALARG